MTAVEFGIGLPRLDAIAASAQRAESLGYDFISTGEHVFFYGPIGNGLISLAAGRRSNKHNQAYVHHNPGTTLSATLARQTGHLVRSCEQWPF